MNNSPQQPFQDFIAIRNPRQLKVAEIPAERAPIGQKLEYKPNIAHLGGLFTGLLLGRVIEPEPLDEPSPASGSEPRAPQHRFR